MEEQYLTAEAKKAGSESQDTFRLFKLPT